MSAVVIFVSTALFTPSALPATAQSARAHGSPASTDDLFRNALDGLEPDTARVRAIERRTSLAETGCLPDAALLAPPPNEPLFQEPRSFEGSVTTWTCSGPPAATAIPNDSASPPLPLTPSGVPQTPTPAEPRQPRYDSTKPKDTERDWELEEFCAWLGAKYDWTTRACVEPKPPT